MTPDSAALWWRVLRAKAWLYWRLTVVMFTRALAATPEEMQALIDGHDRRLRGA